ncbi:MAG TPA: hypothetical protein VEK79_13365 [Thermoanaerobaculia bacterium]|nr:hypothetical protein [Thermoanaerobaculia bacterium]
MRPQARGLAVVLFTILFLGAAQQAAAQFLTFRNHAAFAVNSTINFYPSGGQLYFSDSASNVVGRLDPYTGAVAVIAGGNGQGSQDGHVSVARFWGPRGVAVAGDETIYVSDNHNIRRISSDGYVTTIAGSPTGSPGWVDGNGAAARFYSPQALALDPSGNLWVADTWNNRIRKVEPDGDVTTVAGSTAGSTDGSGAAARFNFPLGIAFNGTDAFYVADQNNSTIRKVTLDGGVSTFAGLAGSNGNVDGSGSAARFYYTTNVAVAPDTGEVFVADAWNHAVRRISPAGVVTTVGGMVSGAGNREGTGYAAQFNQPNAVAALDSQTVFVSDYYTGLVKKGTPSIADEAKIDSANGTVGVARQLSVAPLSATTFAWSVTARPAGSTATFSDPAIMNPTFTPDFEGSYTFRLDASSPAGTSITYVSVVVTCSALPPAPTATRISGNDPSCPGEPITLEASAGYDSYRWQSGATVLSTTRWLTVSPTFSDSYSVRGTLNGCSSSSSYYHTVTTAPAATPTVVLNGGSTVCADGQGGSGGTYSLYPRSYDPPGYARQWGYRTVSGGPITPIAGQTGSGYVINGTHFPGAGTYRIVCTITPSCGFSPRVSEERIVTVRPPVVANITSSAPSACIAQPVTITASGSGGTGGNYDIYIMQKGSPDFTLKLCSNAQTCSVNGFQGRTYYARVWQGNTCTKLSPELTIGANPDPTPQAQAQYTSCQPARAVVVNPNPTSTYVWSNGATGASMTPATSNWYRVTETTSLGCSATSLYVWVEQNFGPSTTVTKSGPTTFCEGGSVTLTAASATSYLWSNGAMTRSVNVTQGGTYTCELTYSGSCKRNSESVVVTVNPAPSAEITADGPTNFCEGGSVTLTAPEGLTYSWSNSATARSIVVNTSGSYSVTTTNADGCSTTSTPTLVTVNALPAATITASGATTFCEGGSVTLTASEGASWLWSNGATTQSIVATQSGGYSVAVTNAAGCSTTSTATTVTVEPLPAATISASGPTSFCIGGSVTLSVAQTSGASYLWSNGATTPDITVSASGTFSVAVTSAAGCTSNSSPVTVAVHPYPTAGIHSSQIYDEGSTGTILRNGDVIDACGTPRIRLVAMALDASYTYAWSTGATTATIDVTTSGTYGVTVTSAAGCATTSSVVVNYGAIPAKPVIASTGTELCPAGGSVTLTAPDADAWTWSNGATTQSIVVTEPGSYTVRVRNGVCESPLSDPLVVTTGISSITTNDALALCGIGSSATLTANDGTSWLWSNGATTQSIVVTEPGTFTVITTNNGCTMPESAPVAVTMRSVSIDANGPTSFCEGDSVTLTANGGTSWLWTNGATTQSITVSESGSYGVTASFGDGCSLAAAPVAVEARRVEVSVSADRTTVCTSGAITLSASAGGGAGYTYQWYDNPYTPIAGATSSTLTIHPTASGYVYAMVRDELGCEATSSGTTYTVLPTPDASITTAPALCEGQNGSASVADAGPGATYAWTITNGQLSSANTPNVTFTPSGTAPVTLTVTIANAGCEVTSSASVAIHALPSTDVTASGPATFCAGGSVTLSAPAGLTYSWSNGATTQSIDVTDSGSYSVTVTNANGCSATSSATAVTVNEVPVATITASGATTFCEGGSVTLTASNGASWLWSNGATTQSIVVNASDDYGVIVTNAAGCSATSSATSVTVNPTPVATITASGATTFCEGDSVTLTASNGASWLWSNGATTQSIVVNTSGDYSVTVTSAAGCGATSSATNVVVNPTPVATIAASGETTFCEGGSVTLTASDGASWLWSNGATSQSIVVNTSGDYSVTVTNAAGCSSISSATSITVNSTPFAAIDASGATTFCEGGSVTLTASDGASWLWSNGATSQSIVVNASGDYSVTVTSAAGCSATSSATNVVVNPTPVAAITASGDTTFCEGGSVTLTASNGASWLWSNGATTQSILVNASGNYSVTVMTAEGCSATSSATTVTVNPMPAATITASGATSFCEGGNVTLTASNGASWLWSNGATSQSIVVNASGSYHVTVSSAAGCSATSDATTVTVNPTPAATITASGDTTFCAGGSVTLTASNGASWLWSNGATSQSIVVNASGNYSVTVTSTESCSAISSATTVTVNPTPAATITPSGATTFCEGGSVTLTASNGASWLWSNGATSPSIVVNESGSYSVTVANASGCSTTSSATNVAVDPLPTPSIATSGPTTFCEGGSVALTGEGSYGGYGGWYRDGVLYSTEQPLVIRNVGTWTFVYRGYNASFCTADSAPVTVTVHPKPSTNSVTGSAPACWNGTGYWQINSQPAATTYLWTVTNGSIVGSASDARVTYQPAPDATTVGLDVVITNAVGCSTTAHYDRPVERPVTPVVTPDGPTSFCPGGSVTLTVAEAPADYSYQWSNGANTRSITVSAGGSYTARYYKHSSGCGSPYSDPVTVAITPAPAATITPSGDTTFCEGGSVTLTASSGASWSWSNGATSQSIDVTTPGEYSVIVTNAEGCTATSSPTTVTVHAPPAATITASGDTTFCTGGSVTLSASDGASWLWSNGATSQSIDVTTSGDYTVIVTNANGCSATSSATTVTVNTATPPSITESGATQFCAGGSVTLTASSGVSYLWSNGSTSPSIDVTSSGEYFVRVTDANGCTSTSPVKTVTVHALPAATITPSGSTTFCEGGTVTLTASGGVSYVWSNGSTSPSIDVTSTGNYTVTVTNANGCTASASQSVTVKPAPPATISPAGSASFCTGGKVTLTASGGASWLWSNGQTSQSISVSTPGNYSVIVTYANGCSKTSAATVVTQSANPSTPQIAVSGPTTFCAGGSVTLTAPDGFASYLWSNGATTRSINVTSTNNYSVIVTNASGCSAQSAARSVTVNPSTTITQHPQSKSIPRNTTTKLSVTASGVGLTYQWYRGTSPSTATPISGATQFEYTTPRLGKGTYTYWVRVTGTCGVANSSTATITVP